MRKITKKMVTHWLKASSDDENILKQAIKVITEIANSKNQAVPWTPHILHGDIKSTCDLDGGNQ